MARKSTRLLDRACGQKPKPSVLMRDAFEAEEILGREALAMPPVNIYGRRSKRGIFKPDATTAMRQFRDKHLGGHCTIIGNGPSLNEIPDEFFKYNGPTFGINYLRMYREIPVTYWCALDQHVMKNDNLRRYYVDSYECFFGRWKEKIRATDRTIWWKDPEHRKGFMFLDACGTRYPTTAHFAVWIACYMGFRDIRLVGVDCTTSAGKVIRPDLLGRAKTPHFYDARPQQRFRYLWDIAWANMLPILKDYGAHIINLSPGSMSVQLPKGDFRDYMG